MLLPLFQANCSIYLVVALLHFGDVLYSMFVLRFHSMTCFVTVFFSRACFMTNVGSFQNICPISIQISVCCCLPGLDQDVHQFYVDDSALPFEF